MQYSLWIPHEGEGGIVAIDVVSQWNRLSSPNYCTGTKLPPFVSSEVQMVIQVAYAPGDKFQIGYKALDQESYKANTLLKITFIINYLNLKRKLDQLYQEKKNQNHQ